MAAGGFLGYRAYAQNKSSKAACRAEAPNACTAEGSELREEAKTAANLSTIATISGGRVFRLFTGRSYALDGLAKVLMEELHQQYLLSYYPAGSGISGFRKLEVKVNQLKGEVRHRTGYYPATAAAPAR